MVDLGTISWSGVLGHKYQYWIYPIGTQFQDKPGNYIYAKEIAPGRWAPLYIGQTESLQNRLANHEKMPCVRGNGGTHIHTHVSGNQQARLNEETDLIRKWSPSCNV